MIIGASNVNISIYECIHNNKRIEKEDKSWFKEKRKQSWGLGRCCVWKSVRGSFCV